MANGIKPQGYYTSDPSIGGGKANTFQYLLDPSDPAGAYKAFLSGKLFPTDVGDYSNITSKSPLTQGGPFNILPTSEGALSLGIGAVNPIFGFMTRGAINARNAEALETLANAGILETITPAKESTGLRKFLNSPYVPETGEYRLAPDVEKAILATGSTPQEYFEQQYQSQYGDASELARYLDQMAYVTKGQFFQEDLFGNPTAISKYVDRQGNIRPDALENWKKFGSQDKRGVLNMFDQGTQESSSRQESSGSGGIDDLFKGQVSEPRDSTPDFLQTPTRSRETPRQEYQKYDPGSGRTRTVAGGTTNLFRN